MSKRIGILGATGYTAGELIKILLSHPQAEISRLTSRQDEGLPIDRVHRELSGVLDVPLEPLDVSRLAEQVDFVFSCLPHAASAQSVAPLVEAGVPVVDFSADYRLNDPQLYAQWYGPDHVDAARMNSVPYGLPELFRESIIEAKLVANPGCYPTSAILPLAPLLAEGYLEPDGIVIDAKSGVSGAGRTPKLATLYGECNESISAYNVGCHRHMPEIQEVLSTVSSREVDVLFVPHLTPMFRGILATIYARPSETASEEALRDVLKQYYADEPFVEVVEHLPATRHVSGSNKCHIAVRVIGDRVVLVSCIDNLVKGASGAAVQNFNVMCGYEETTALL